ncbi:hypothetical protein ACI3PL_24535, partial [Lacticaseibacillus paracasei]
MKYKIGQKLQDKRDLIRGRVVDYYEQDDTKYWIATKRGNLEFLESELEPVIEARVCDFCKRVWSWCLSDLISALVIFGLGFLGGILL